MWRTKMMNNVLTFSSQPLKEKYYKYTHVSGLDIYVFPKKMTSTYAIMGTKYGSIDSVFKTDADKEFIRVPDGIAHFLEHKLFTNEDGSDSFERFSEYGADANAYTSFNKTAYLFSCTERVEDSLRELVTFVTHPYFTDESVKKEQGIIAQEIKMYDDNPADRCFYGMLEGMYKDHSIRKNICGTVDSISKITPELLYDCYNVFYDLSNMMLIVCGDVECEKILNTVIPLLPDTSTKKSIIRSDENSKEKAAVAKSRITQRMNVSKPMFCIGVKDTDIPKDADERQKKDAAMSILDEMLFARCTPFYEDLLEREIITPSFSYGYNISESSAYNSFAGEAQFPETVLGEIKKYLSDVRKKGLDRGDFKRAKRVMYAEYVKLFDSTDNIANTILSFACEEAELFRYSEIMDKISFEDVEALFYSVFKDEYFTLSEVLPLANKEN